MVSEKTGNEKFNVCKVYIRFIVRVGRLVGCFGLNSHLRQYFRLCQAVSQREGERKEK